MAAPRTLVMALAKVIVAAAWADGDLATDEVNSMKDLLYRLPQSGSGPEAELNATEWAELEIYLHSPVGPDERARLVEDLKVALRGPRDQQLALSALDELLRADRVVTEEERAVAQEIQASISTVDLNIFSQIGRLVSGPLQQRTQTMANAPNREHYFEDFLKNRIYYSVRQRLNMEPEADLGIPEDEARKLSLAGGLLARVAHVDAAVTDEEFATMTRVLQASWQIAPTSATLVAEVALSEVAADLDFYRLTREFATNTSIEERIAFLDALFAVAAADGEISSDESSEISRITQGINLTQQDFIAAKVKVRE